jgi:hypothetical protein
LLLPQIAEALRVGSSLTGWQSGRMGSSILTLAALVSFAAILTFTKGTKPSACGGST